jgi:hypothetical protein
MFGFVMFGWQFLMQKHTVRNLSYVYYLYAYYLEDRYLNTFFMEVILLHV